MLESTGFNVCCCPLCKGPFLEGDQVVTCGTATHRAHALCMLQREKCMHCSRSFGKATRKDLGRQKEEVDMLHVLLSGDFISGDSLVQYRYYCLLDVSAYVVSLLLHTIVGHSPNIMQLSQQIAVLLARGLLDIMKVYLYITPHLPSKEHIDMAVARRELKLAFMDHSKKQTAESHTALIHAVHTNVARSVKGELFTNMEDQRKLSQKVLKFISNQQTIFTRRRGSPSPSPPRQTK